MRLDPLFALQAVTIVFALLGTWLLRKPGRWAPWGFVAWLVSNPAAMVFMAANQHWGFFALHTAFLVLAALGVWHWIVARPAVPDAQLLARDAALWREHAPRWEASLNRRATVEQLMFDAAHGKRPLPGPQELREWATKLGVPAELRFAVDAPVRGGR